MPLGELTSQVTSRRTIVIMGTPLSSGNRGVLALGASLTNLCSKAARGCNVVIMLVQRDNRPVFFRVNGEPRQITVIHARRSMRTHPRHHVAWILLMAVLYRFVPSKCVRTAIKGLTPWIDTLVAADLVGNIHGGDSFSDIYGLKRMVESFLVDWTVVLVKGFMVQFPQTYGPYKSPIARWLARLLLKHSCVIIARDKQSQQIARDLVGPAKEVLLSPDVAFALESIRPNCIDLDPPRGCNVSTSVIGLNVNGLMYNGGYTGKNMFGLTLNYVSFLPQLVTTLLREHSGELWLVPHTLAPDGDVESDPEASRKLRDVLPADLRARVRIVNRDYDQYEIKGIIGQCDFFVGSRMHACIAALSQGVPCVGVAYSMKFSGVFESVGMQEWVIDGRTSTADGAVSRTLELFRRRNSVRPDLLRASAEARHQLATTFTHLISSVASKTR